MRALLLPRVSAQFMDSELASEMYVDEVLTGDGQFVRLDNVSRVTAMDDGRVAIWPDARYTDQQYRRFLNGS